MFYFYHKFIIFWLNKEKGSFFHETVSSHNLDTTNHMKTHLLTNQNARTIQIIL